MMGGKNPHMRKCQRAMRWPHMKTLSFPLRFVRRDAICALRDRDGVAVPQPFLGVSSLDFGPSFGAAFFLG
jgi:hypothetical protein